MDLLKSHRTIRKYSSQRISEEILNDILESSVCSSNTGNMQLYSIIVTRDDSMKRKLAPLHFNQPMVIGASVVLTVCMDFNRFLLWCKTNNTSTELKSVLWLLNGFIDSSVLAQNICVAAENLSIGICYLGTTLYNSKEIISLLELPRGVIPVTTLTLGYPDFIPEKTDRLPLEAIVHYERYSDYSLDQIKDIYSVKENLESSKRFVSENSKANLAQVYTEVRYKSSDSIAFSKKMLELLNSQGFNFVL